MEGRSLIGQTVMRGEHSGCRLGARCLPYDGRGGGRR